MAHAVLSQPGREPERFVLFLHGILGRGNNWRAFARQLVARRPEIGAVLVDLRAHGDSRDLPPPDDLDAAAGDVIDIAEDLPLAGLLGHSFGGKVALAALDRLRPPQLFVVDSLPGARPDRRGSEGTVAVVELLSEMPPRWATREDFVLAIVKTGFREELAQWLAQNLDREGDGFRFGLEMDRVRALLDDYFERDLWPAIDPPPPGVGVHLVIGGRS